MERSTRASDAAVYDQGRNLKRTGLLHPEETSAGFLLDSREFLIAAELVLNKSNHVSLPVYFLLARSIELSLKAFLLEAGMTPKTLGYKPFGHNLVTLYEETKKGSGLAI